MTTSHQVLACLAETRSTPSAVAGRLRMPERIVTAFLQDLADAGHATPTTISGSLAAWSITKSGRKHLGQQPATTTTNP